MFWDVLAEGVVLEVELAQLGHATDLRGDFSVELVVVDAQAGEF